MVMEMIDARPRLPDWSAWALFLDIDGTLLDLAPAPDAVTVPDGLIQRLDSLSRHLCGAVALISGRSLDSIDRLFPGGGDVAGTHGAEVRRSGRVSVAVAPWPEEMTRWIRQETRHLPAVRYEEKTCSLALHHPAGEEIASDLVGIAQQALAAAPVPLKLIRGKNVIELMPDGPDKGQAIEHFLDAPPYAGRIPVFLGDDLTDEDGFRTVNRLGGLSAHVGPHATAARYRLGSPAEVRHWLARLDVLIGDPP